MEVLKKTIRDLSLEQKKVLVRVDYNVPFNGSGTVQDSTRLHETKETIQYLLDRHASVILISHLGRPKGKRDPKYSLQPVAKILPSLFGRRVEFGDDCVGPQVSALAGGLKPGEILLLENLRFHPEEENNEESFARSLASLGDLFVQEAFSALHRAHASIVGIPKFLPGAAGFLLEKELTVFSELLNHAERPFLVILGGAKVSDKIGVIKSLLKKVDAFVIGGAMAFTFLKAIGFSVGNSLVEDSPLEEAAQLLKNNPGKIQLPVDVTAAPSLQEARQAKEVRLGREQENFSPWTGFDIGRETSRMFAKFIFDRKPKTIFWNGPMGVFEVPEFARGTLEIAKVLAECAKTGTQVVVGGGDSVAALNQLGLAGAMSHISTGGGACLEFLEGKTLPGLAALSESSA